MPRPLRVELPGGIHHVTARATTRQNLFLDDDDRRRYLLQLGRTCRWTSWRCLSYCLMSNHIHLLVETPKPNLSRGMQRFHGDYATSFNRRHRRSGHVFQARFHPVTVDNEEQLWATVSYIVNNPVKARLCPTPESWPWSSHSAIVDGKALPWLDEERLFGYLAEYGGDPRWCYEQLVKGSGPLGLGV
jgi:REP element-mobilizing transposase RayT